ncbi:MAG TPA: tripartite tricarboxylate transporter substrate binding protein [Xanthobacteraceae bacterium]|jgi:tripartite-type tricarboxylate transporter receptor subunit TctC|nr:tripartite tricarboxylate transporter substrate binding protein [Xanthobacteraceae bacterium]
MIAKATRALSRRALLATAFPAMAVTIARAQTATPAAAYPDRQVTFIVPFAPAGGTDVLARLLAEQLEQALGAPFVVENRPGAGTVIATNFVVKSPPDGYTIMMDVSSLAIDVTLYKSLPYDPAKDLALVALIARVPFVLVVNPSLQVNSVEDLIKLAKQRPLSYGSGGIGAFHHLAAALFCSMTGIKMTHVPYRGTAPALNDVMGGYIQLMFSDLGPALPLINAGKIRPLAVTTKERFAALPNVPPLADAGVPGFDAAAWQAVAAPAKTPQPVLAKLNSQLNAVMARGDVRTRISDFGMIPVGSGSLDDLRQFFQSEIARWAKVVEEAGIAHSE